MGLPIDPWQVRSVLLHDGRHRVLEGSFDLDSYEFGYEYTESDEDGDTKARLLHRAGESGVCSTRFVFKEPDGLWISGPLTAVHAVRYSRDRGPWLSEELAYLRQFAEATAASGSFTEPPSAAAPGGSA